MAKSYAPKQRARKKAPLERLYIVAAILLLLAWGSSIMATSSMAKYSTSASVSDNARVAKFSVTSAADPAQTTADVVLNSENTTATYKFNVTSNSEVTTKYDVKLTTPTEFVGVTPTLQVGSAGAELPATHTRGTTEYTFTGVNTVNAGVQTTDALTLTFKLDATTASSADYSNISLSVTATQID